MAYTLADMQQLAKDPLKREIIDIFRRESFMLDYLPWEKTGTLATQGIRTKSLPSVAFRKIGETFSESKGTVEPFSERVHDIGGFIDVDKLLVESDTIVDQRALQTDFYVTAMAYQFNDSFISGSQLVDEDSFSGLFYRLKQSSAPLPAAQEKNKNGLDISPDAAALAANEDTYLDGLQEAMHAIDAHLPDNLLMNETLFLRTMSAIRKKGLFATTQDNYGRTVMTYGPGGPKIQDLGVKADQSTFILPNLEAADGSLMTGGTATSVWVLRLGAKYLTGVQLYDIDTNDVGLLENGVAYRTVVDWPVGLMITNPRSVARLSGIQAS